MAMTRAGLLVVVSLGLAACSLSSEREDYKNAAVMPPLEVPPRLQLPQGSEVMPVPAAPATAPATAPVAGAAAAPVATAQPQIGLPALAGVQLMRDGAQRWLVVESAPAAVWDRLQAYWRSVGVPVQEADPTFLTMTTEWISPGTGGESGFLRKMLDKLRASSIKDQYRVRIEPGSRSGTSEVYVSHLGLHQVEQDDTVRWMPRPSDPELERTQLQRMMVFLGLPEEQAKTLLLRPEQVKVAFHPSADGPYLAINAPLDWAWRRVGQGLDRAGVTQRGRDEQARAYHITVQVAVQSAAGSQRGIEVLPAWMNAGVKTEPRQFVVKLEAKEGEVRVIVLDEQGARADAEQAERLLKQLHEKME